MLHYDVSLADRGAHICLGPAGVLGTTPCSDLGAIPGTSCLLFHDLQGSVPLHSGVTSPKVCKSFPWASVLLGVALPWGISAVLPATVSGFSAQVCWCILVPLCCYPCDLGSAASAPTLLAWLSCEPWPLHLTTLLLAESAPALCSLPLSWGEPALCH